MPTPQASGGIPSVIVKNGTRVNDRKSKTIYLMIDSVLRKIPSDVTYNMLFRAWTGIVDVDVNEYNIGPPIPADAALRGTQQSVILVMGGEARPVVDTVAMDLFFFNWVTLTPISYDDLNKLTPGPPVQIDFPDDGFAVFNWAGGQFGPEWGETYISLDGTLRQIPFEMVPLIYRSRLGMISLLSLAAQLKIGDPMPANTSLRKYANEKEVYLRVGGERRWIISSDVFEQRQFDWTQIQVFETDDKTVKGKDILNSYTP